MVKIKIIPAQVQELPKGAFEDTINAPEFVGVVPYLTGKADCGIRSGSQLTVMKAEHTSSPASFASASSSFTIVPPLGSATSTSMTERTFASDDRRYFPENATYGVADLQPLKVLGAGCFGTVYMAKDRLTGKDLAVKVTEELCLDEQRALRRVEGCKAFLQLHASWRDESHCFLATDYCANGDLRSEVDRQGKLSEAYAKVLIAELLLALDELHGLGMVHRDVKPENILFDSEGHIVLADFGLVRDLKDSEVASPPDPNNDIPAGCTRSDCGTLDYMAPEMINKEPYSYGVDFWAMGVLLYFLLTGRLPFGNGLSDYPPIVMAAMILVKDPTFEDSDLVSPVARDFIQSVLQKDRSSRLSVDEMKAHAFFADV
ncbi:kinase-like protein [Auriscalpium vulgare]|uniref:Kinase-like protein n=1 Tax=Auriscalpium vulgare TaxID=40419 RepID=A0ACB8S8D2_9AGAM|nr:kinase-like protein [Auriscalpium vulgare]